MKTFNAGRIQRLKHPVSWVGGRGILLPQESVGFQLFMASRDPGAHPPVFFNSKRETMGGDLQLTSKYCRWWFQRSLTKNLPRNLGKICRLLTFLFIISDGWVETTNHSNHRLKSRPCGLYMLYNGAFQGEYFHSPAIFLGCSLNSRPPKAKKSRWDFGCQLAGYVLPQIFMTCELSMMAPLSNSGVTCWISRAFGRKAGKCIGLNMLLWLGSVGIFFWVKKCLQKHEMWCLTWVLEKMNMVYLNMFNIG